MRLQTTVFSPSVTVSRIHDGGRSSSSVSFKCPLPASIQIVIGLSFFYMQLVNANLDVKARTAILQDYYSGEILFEKEPDISIFPASMTKIMT